MELRPSLFNIHPWTQPFNWGHSNCTPSRYSAAYFLENGWMMEISHELKKKYYAWKIMEHEYQLYFTSKKGLNRENLKKFKPWKWNFLVNQHSQFSPISEDVGCIDFATWQMTILILFNCNDSIELKNIEIYAPIFFK